MPPTDLDRCFITFDRRFLRNSLLIVSLDSAFVAVSLVASALPPHHVDFPPFFSPTGCLPCEIAGRETNFQGLRADRSRSLLLVLAEKRRAEI